MSISRAAIIGGGVIGAGWAARLIENGIDVAIYDPAPNAKSAVEAVLANADRAYARLTIAVRRNRGNVSHAATIAEAVIGAELIVESVPERLDIKRAVYAEIEASADDAALVASSTSGLMPSDLQAEMRLPGRLLVAHPFNPVYLLPVVEIVAGTATTPDTIESALSLYAGLGMKPIHVRKEIEAFVADRLLESIWRESLWLIKDGICTTEELDDIVRFGFGLRYAQMGVFETFRVAGGEAGMRHFMAQFGPCLKWPWTRLMDVPEFNDELVDLIAEQSDSQSGHHSIRELERIRDDNLVAIQQALRANGWGAGEVLAEYENRLLDAGAQNFADSDLSQPLVTLDRRIQPGGTDDTARMTTRVPAHVPARMTTRMPARVPARMNEVYCQQCFASATDAFLRMIGVDPDHDADGRSHFTEETHIRRLVDVRGNEPVHVTTQLIEVRGTTLHLFHRLFHQDGTLLATSEHLLRNIRLESRSPGTPEPGISARLDQIARCHAKLGRPEGMGHAVGQSFGAR